MYVIPMCAWCGELEVGSFVGGDETFCSPECREDFEMAEDEHDVDEDGDLSDEELERMYAAMNDDDRSDWSEVDDLDW